MTDTRFTITGLAVYIGATREDAESFARSWISHYSPVGLVEEIVP